MRISDWSSDVCSSDLSGHGVAAPGRCRQGRVAEQAGGRHGAQTALMETSADKLSALLLALALHAGLLALLFFGMRWYRLTHMLWVACPLTVEMGRGSFRGRVCPSS